MPKPKFSDIETALGLRDRTHRHRIAKAHEIPIGSGDTAPDWPELAGMIYQRMMQYSKRPESADELELKEQKLREEINVLQERHKKLEIENETKTGNMVDVRELHDLQVELSAVIRKAGDLMGRKTKLTGRDAQQILNKALDEFYRLLQDRLPAPSGP